MIKLPQLRDKIFESNPFVLELKGKMYLQAKNNTIVAKGDAIIDTITGEIKTEQVLMGSRKIVDKSQFAKIYVSELSMLLELSKKSMNVLLYLMKNMDYDNKVYFHYDNDKLKAGYSSKTPIISGLRELIANNIIASTHMLHWYWINPIYVCKGERFSKYTEYVTTEYAEKNGMIKEQIDKERDILNEDGIGKKVLLAEKQQDSNYYNMNQLEMDI